MFACGWELPWRRWERVYVDLRNLRTGCEETSVIVLNSLEVQTCPVEIVLGWGGIGLPDYEETKELLDKFYRPDFAEK